MTCRRTAIALCQRRFADDPSKSFFLYDGTCFTDRAGVFTADLALSLDVVYHLTEDTGVRDLPAAPVRCGRRLVVIYSTNMEIGDTAPHVRHRRFTPWVEANCPEWTLSEVNQGRTPNAQGRLLRVPAIMTNQALRRPRRPPRAARLAGHAGPVLLLAPSRGLGGGIERYVETVQAAFRDRGVACQRLDLPRPGPVGLPGAAR